MSNFTKEDLLQYLYNETSKEKTEAIVAALHTDWSLRESFDLLALSLEHLDNVQLLSPRQQTVDNILNYAAATAKQVEA